MKIKLGTRASKLAQIQTKLVVDRMRAMDPSIETEIVTITTRGDRNQTKPLHEIGGNGLFVGEFEEALRQGAIDVAVHSGKDLPSESAPAFGFVTLPRASANDILIYREGTNLELSFVCGTSSMRRRLLMEQRYPQCTFTTMRGNVDTRIRKLRAGECDVLVLAEAGVTRLSPDLDGLVVERMDVETFIPTACQGIIACEYVKGGDFDVLMERIDHSPTHEIFDVEREVMRRLGASCHDAAGIFGSQEGDKIHMRGFFKEYRIHEALIQRDEVDSFVELWKDE